MATLAKRIQDAAAWRARRIIYKQQDFNDRFRAYLNSRRAEKVPGAAAASSPAVSGPAELGNDRPARAALSSPARLRPDG